MAVRLKDVQLVQIGGIKMSLDLLFVDNAAGKGELSYLKRGNVIFSHHDVGLPLKTYLTIVNLLFHCTLSQEPINVARFLLPKAKKEKRVRRGRKLCGKI